MIKQIANLLAANETATLSVARTSNVPAEFRVVVNFPNSNRPSICLDGTVEELASADLTPVAEAHRSLAEAVKAAADATIARAKELREQASKKPVRPSAPAAAKAKPTPEPEKAQPAQPVEVAQPAEVNPEPEPKKEEPAAEKKLDDFFAQFKA